MEPFIFLLASLLKPFGQSGEGIFSSITNYLDDPNPPLLQYLIPSLNQNIVPELTKTKYFAWYAAAAVCPVNQLMSWQCKSCQIVNPAAKPLNYLSSTVSGTTAYLAVDEKVKYLILSFRGTTSFQNEIDDVVLAPVPFIEAGGLATYVVGGYFDEMKSLSNQFLNLTNSYLSDPKYAEYRMAVIGHSSAGAVASLGAAQILSSLGSLAKSRVEVYTYGQPRTGNINYALWLNQQRVPVVRVVNFNDPIPHMVSGDTGYSHHTNEIWLNGTYPNYTVATCNNGTMEDSNCSDSVNPITYNATAHLQYFDTVMGDAGC